MLPTKKEDEKPEWLQHAISEYLKSGRGDGDILTHDWIAWALKLPAFRTVEEAKEHQWVLLQRFDAFREWLLYDRKTALQSVRRKGYWIVPPSEHARVAAEEWAHAVAKAAKKADASLTNARFEEMDNDARRRHTDAHVRITGVNEVLGRQRKDVFQLFAVKVEDGAE
ncbi:MAG: hypothetical protein EA420_16420 [Candidatus Competibacteraceae bacterium]|nr:MAG: hypothetical protein EA420_16420 [Candidatus Competibacteraceae bacterium]